MLSSALLTVVPVIADRWAWGSRSIPKGVCPRRASAADRLSDVVVFPTPPFWLKIAILAKSALGARTPLPQRKRLRYFENQLVVNVSSERL